MKGMFPNYEDKGPPDHTNEIISRRKIKASRRRKGKVARKARRINRQRAK